MNYLSHYKVGGGQSDPAYTTGKILPDLIRRVDKSLRISAQPVDSWPPALATLYAGIATHLETDAVFHQSDWFAGKVAYTKTLLQEIMAPAGLKYRFFYAHILVEMIADRVVMKQQPTLLDNFYTQLSLLDKATLSYFFQYNGWERYSKKGWDVLQRFIAAKYLYQYTNNAELVFALGRVVSQVGLTLFGEPYKSKLLHGIDEMEKHIASDIGVIFEAIENRLDTCELG